MTRCKPRAQPADFDAILANVVERDHLDSTREIAPLKESRRCHRNRHLAFYGGGGVCFTLSTAPY